MRACCATSGASTAIVGDGAAAAFDALRPTSDEWSHARAAPSASATMPRRAGALVVFVRRVLMVAISMPVHGRGGLVILPARGRIAVEPREGQRQLAAADRLRLEREFDARQAAQTRLGARSAPPQHPIDGLAELRRARRRDHQRAQWIGGLAAGRGARDRSERDTVLVADLDRTERERR